MRLSREKINILSHRVADTLAEIDEVTFKEDRNTIRLQVLQVINKWLAKEAEMDRAARPQDRIAGQTHSRGQSGMGHPLQEVLRRRIATTHGPLDRGPA